MKAIDSYFSNKSTELYKAAVSYLLTTQDHELQILQDYFAKYHRDEAFIGYLLARQIWWHTSAPIDFINVWECARFSGTKYTAINDHLQLAENLPDTSAKFLLLGNLMRHHHQYSAAEDAYLKGIHLFPNEPLLKFRLADLWLSTYKLSQAQQILNSLKPSYPYTREMMFIGPTTDLQVPDEIFGELACNNEAPYVWFVAADNKYMDEYALHLAGSVEPNIFMHFHLIGEPNTTLNQQLVDLRKNLTITSRPLSVNNDNPIWRKAYFSVERFLFLAELLTKYNKPILVTDIDVECLQSPAKFFEQVSDIGYTHFRNTTEAWERYAATALLVKPTPNSIEFFRRMAAMSLALLNSHPQPWFVDQIVLFRLFEEFPTVQATLVPHLLTEKQSSNTGYLRLLHASWNKN